MTTPDATSYQALGPRLTTNVTSPLHCRTLRVVRSRGHDSPPT
jgi:hypothetical protein